MMGVLLCVLFVILTQIRSSSGQIMSKVQRDTQECRNKGFRVFRVPWGVLGHGAAGPLHVCAKAKELLLQPCGLILKPPLRGYRVEVAGGRPLTCVTCLLPNEAVCF